MVRVLILILIFLIKGISVLAQQDVQFSQYMFLNSYINPGAAGIYNATEASAVFRAQWLGYKTTNSTGNDISGSPVSQLVSASTKIQQINSGIGLFILNDQLGPINNLDAKISYTYHIALSEKTQLGLGIRSGIYFQRFNTDVWRYNQPDDQRLLTIPQSSTNFDLGAGLFIRNERYYAGLSFSHLNKPMVSPATINSNDYNQSFIYRHYYLVGGYNFLVSENWKLSPSVFIKSDLLKVSNSQIDLTALMKYKSDRFWGGLSYRNYDAIVALIGIGILRDNSLKIGYAFDLTVLGGAAKAGTSHEIMLTYSKPVTELLPKPAIRTPRFRF